MLSKVFIIGRITAKPTLTMLSTSSRVMTKFSIAVNKNNGSGQADFFNIVAFDKTAELVEKYLSKGSLVYIEGNLRQSNYTNNEGKKIYSVDIYANNVIFLESRGASNNNNNNSAANHNIKQTDFLANEMLQNFQTQMPINDSEISFSNKSNTKDTNKANNVDEIEEHIQWENSEDK